MCPSKAPRTRNFGIPDIIRDAREIRRLTGYLKEKDVRLLTGVRTWAFGHLVLEPFAHLVRRRLYPHRYARGGEILVKYAGFGNPFVRELLEDAGLISFWDPAVNAAFHTVAKASPELTVPNDIGMPFRDFAPDPAELPSVMQADVRNTIPQRRLLAAELKEYERHFGNIITIPEQYGHAFQAVLAMLGLSEGDWFVVMHMAESGHNKYKYSSFRRHCFDRYLDVAEHITSNGGYVLRLADASTPALQTNNRRIIDYAHWPFRTPLSDICILHECRYVITADSGPLFYPYFAGKPVIMFAMVPFSTPPWPRENMLILHSKVYSKSKCGFLSYREQCNENFGLTYHLACASNDMEEQMNNSYRLEANSPSELCEAVDEMHWRLEHGKQNRTQEQKLARAIIGEEFAYDEGEIAQGYLCNNPYLLEG